MGESERPLVVFRHSIDFPSAGAHALQIAQNANSLAENGADVWLSFAKWNTPTVEDAYKSFGLVAHPRVTKMAWPRFTRGLRAWRGPLFRLLLRRRMRRVLTRRPVFYFRDKLASFETILELCRIRESLNSRLVLESHTFQASKRGNRSQPESAPDPTSPASAEQVELSAVREVDLFIGVSDSLRDRLSAAAGRKRASVTLRNGATQAKSEDRPLVGRSGVVYLGHPDASKGVDDLVCAMALVPGAHLTIVGCKNSEERNRVEEWARSSGILDRVTITGRLTHDQVFQHLSAARVGTSPLRHGDGSPLKVFEYMSAGLPIVATDVPANREVIADSGAGVLVPTKDPVAFGAALSLMLSDDAVAERYRQAGLTWIGHNLWEHRARRLFEALDAIPAPRDRVATA